MIYIMQGNHQQQNRAVQEMELLRDQHFQLTATAEQKLERDKLREEQRQRDNRNNLNKDRRHWCRHVVSLYRRQHYSQPWLLQSASL